MELNGDFWIGVGFGILGTLSVLAGAWALLTYGIGTAERFEHEDYPAFADTDSRKVKGLDGQAYRRPR